MKYELSAARGSMRRNVHRRLQIAELGPGSRPRRKFGFVYKLVTSLYEIRTIDRASAEAGGLDASADEA